MPSSWRQRLLGPRPRATAVRVLVLAILSAVTFTWILIPVRAAGVSMLPTLSAGFHVVNRLAFTFREPRRGDIVAVRFAGPHVLLLKRVIGLPGERLSIAAGVVMIDGQPLAEPYVTHRAPWQFPAVQLRSGEYFVIGDNRGMPANQHDFGRTARSRIVGKVLF